MMICGLDPGLRQTGYGIIESQSNGGIKLIDAGVINSNSKNDLPHRLQQIYQELSELLREYPLTHIAIEELYSHYRHPRTAILMGHARGVLLLAANIRNLPVTNLSATKIKKAITGSGHASKIQVQRAVISHLGINPAETDIPADVTDALAAAICCYEHQR